MELEDGMKVKIIFNTGVKGLGKDEVDSLINCYADVYNESWPDETWDYETARKTVLESLAVTKSRKPILAILKKDNKVVGFSWIILTSKDSINSSDLPFNLSQEEIAESLRVIKLWNQLAKKDKVVILKETGIRKECRIIKRRHAGSLLHEPIFQHAAQEGFKVLFYWTSFESPAYSQGINAGWHPIIFFPQKNRVIIKGDVTTFVEQLKLINSGDREIFSTMRKNKKLYYC